jgi:hypothetical protein
MSQSPLEHFNWELFAHPPYSPDPRDCHLFTYLKNWMGSQRFNNEVAKRQNVAELTGGRPFNTGIQKFTPRYHTRPNSGGDYVE